MGNDAVVRARIDSDAKARATEALQAMGLSVSDVIRLPLLRVADERRLSFAVRAPNAATPKATKELAGGEGARFENRRKPNRSQKLLALSSIA